MKQIRKHTQKAKKTTSKNTRSGVKNENRRLPLYKVTKENQIERLRDPALYPKENRSRLEDIFLNDYEEFMRFFMNTYSSIPSAKFDKFLTSHYFQTFQKQMSVRQKGNRRRKTLNESDLDTQFELRWNMFLDIFEDMLEDLPDDLRDIATSLLRPQLHVFKKILDLDRKNKGKSTLRDSFLTQAGTDFVSY